MISRLNSCLPSDGAKLRINCDKTIKYMHIAAACERRRPMKIITSVHQSDVRSNENQFYLGLEKEFPTHTPICQFTSF